MNATNDKESISDAVAQIGSIPSMEELDISCVRLAVVLRLLRAAGWDVFDISQVAPDFRTGSGTVDFALTPPSIRVGGTPDSPQVVVWVKPSGEDLGRPGNERRIIAQCVKAGAPLAVLTNGRRWLLLFWSPESSGGGRHFCDIDLLEDPDAAAENLNRYLSRDRVFSGQAARSADRALQEQNRGDVARQAILESWRRVVGGLDKGLLELVATAAEQRAGYTPASRLVRQVLMEHRGELLPGGGMPAMDGVSSRRRPASFTLLSETRAVSSWPDLLAKVCLVMRDWHREEFERILEISGRTLSYFSRSEGAVHIPREIGDSGIYASCQGGGELLEKRARQVVVLFGYPAESLTVELR